MNKKLTECPNCGAKGEDIEIISDTEIFCKKCNLTYKITEGKAQPAGGGRLKILEENQARTQEEIQRIKKNLFGEDEDFY